MVSIANRLNVGIHKHLIWRILKMLEGKIWVCVCVCVKDSADVVQGQEQKL